MPARRVLLLLAVLLVFDAASAIVVRGAHGPSTEDAVLVAQQRWGMLCTAAGAQVDCVEPTGSDFPTRKAFIQPATGPMTSVVTRVNGLFTDRWVLQDADKAWMASMQVVGRADAKGVASFMDKVAAMADPAVPDSVPPQNVGECSLSATLESLRACGQPCYIVNSTLLLAAASPAPTPTPSPTTSPTALPTVTPPTGTATPTPRATASPSSTAPTPSPIVSGSPTATATPTATPSATPTATPTGDSSSAVATASPSPTPEQQVAGGNPTPSPSSDASGPVTRRGPGLFARSVPSVGGVSGDPVALGGSALLAILLVLFVAFPGELFNDTVESNFDEIAGWFRRGPIAYLGGVLAFLPRGPIAIALFVAVAAFLNALLDPGLGLDVASLATYLGFLVALVVTLIAFDGPPLFVHRRRTGELGSMRVLPWTLLIVAFFVVVSRVAALQPGYLYGIVLGIVFVREVGPATKDGSRPPARPGRSALRSPPGCCSGCCGPRRQTEMRSEPS